MVNEEKRLNNITTDMRSESILPDDIDPECRALCEALNRLPGIRTTESCCGHGESPFRIWFMADSLDALPRVAYWFDGCHSGEYDWRIIASTDCGMSPISFMAEGPVGDYAGAEIIAEKLTERVDRGLSGRRWKGGLT